MKMKWIIPILMVLAMTGTAYAQNSVTSCVDASTLEENTTIINNGIETVISVPASCTYGCANNQCTPAATLNETNAIFFILLFAALLIGGGASENVFIVGLSGPIGVLIGLSLWMEGILIGGTLIENTYTSGIGLMFIMVSIYLSFGAYIDYRGRKEI